MATDTKKETVDPLRMKHDEFVRFYLSEKETAISFLQNYLPLSITEHMDFKSLIMPKDSFLNKRMARYYSDILYEVQLKKTTVFIYLLIEHKHKKDAWVGFQLLKYFVRIWELYLKQHKKAKKLPLILPIVIYHGESEWNSDTQFLSLLDVPPSLLESVRQYVPNFNFNLQDISHMPDEEIKGAVLLQIMLLTMKHVGKPGFEEKLQGISRLIGQLRDKTRGIEHIEVLLHYLSRHLPREWAQKLEEVIPNWLEEGGDTMVTIADAWLSEGKAKGRVEGRVEGEVIGMEKKTWEFIKNAFSLDLPMEMIEKLTGLPAEQINLMKRKMA